MFNEQINKKDIWNPYFYKSFAGYQSILALWQNYEHLFLRDWPTVEDFNHLIGQHVHASLRFIIQQDHMCYESQIYRHGLIPMRSNNWHDFFNNLTWAMWPKLKWAIIQKTCEENNQKEESTSKQRTPRQNLLAHFDECGMVFCSDKPLFFEYIAQDQWKKLFWNNPDLTDHCLPVVVGHGLFEKFLTPYRGMTAKVIFFSVPSHFFAMPHAAKMHYVDNHVSEYILSKNFSESPQSLQPFPLLGWPGWDELNHLEAFYENMQYFRTRMPKAQRANPAIVNNFHK